MSVFDDDVPKFTELDRGWGGPADAAAFLAMLAKTPAFGATDAARVAAFMALPQASKMPRALRGELRLRRRG